MKIKTPKTFIPASLARILLGLPFLISIGLFGLYLIFGFFLVDPLAKKILPWVGEEKLASQLSVQQVEFNPLTLELTVQDLRLKEKGGQPLAGFDRLYVNLETIGLFRWAWRLRDVELSGPHADVVVRKGGRLNWADLIARLEEDKKPPSDSMPRVLIDRIKIEKGDVEYRDENRSGKPFRVTLQPLGIELDGLSTLPEDRGDYVIAAKLPEHGGVLKWKGDVSLNPLKSDGEVALEGVSLTRMLNVIKTPRNFEIPSGVLAAGTRYRFAMVREPSGEDKPWLQVNGANAVVQNLELAPKGGGAPMLEMAEAKVGNANLDLYARKLDIAEVGFKTARLAATRERDGTLDWQKLFAVAEEHAPQPADKPKSSTDKKEDAPWQLAVRSIRAQDWSARYADNGYVRPLRIEAGGFALDAALSGEIGSVTAIKVGPVNASLGPVKAFSGAELVAALGGISMSNAGFDVAANELGIEAVELSGLKTDVILDKNRQLNWNTIMARHQATTKGLAVAAVTEKQAVKVKLASLSLKGMQVAVNDLSTPRPVRLDIVNGHARLQDLSLDYDKPVKLEAGLDLRQGGKLGLSGSLVPGKPSGRMKFKATGISLKPLAPYVSQLARLDLESGALTTSGRLNFAKGKSGMKLNYDGGFSVNDLAIIEEETAEAFLGWEKLASDTLQVSLGPDRLHMNELVATRPFGKVIIFEDQSINLKRILRKQEVTDAQASTTPIAAEKQERKEPTADKSTEAEGAEAFPVAIERLKIDNANAEFADLSLPTKFGTRMHSLSGVVSGLSTDPATTAQVELDGGVDDYGSVRVRGAIQPFRATDFTDITLAFRNLEMTRLTPYSGKFAGREIDSGRLSVDLQYKIKNRQLSGENKFVINKLKLGERVDSPDALKLPLDLAIALLQDGNGVIDIDLPISGSLDDPQFSYGKIIWKAVVNVLTKLVTAPFRALGSLLGISAEQMESVDFDAGSSMLLPPELEKLKTLTEALAKRPALTLTLEPSYDPAADRRALQERAMRRDAAAIAGIKLAEGEAPGPVDINNYKIQTWLEDRYAAVAGKDDYQKLRSSYRDKDANPARKLMESELVERLGRGFKTRDPGPPSAFHAELLERLTIKTEIKDAALIKLAEARGQAMRDALLKLGLDAGRISVAASGKQDASNKLVPSRMSLGAGGRKASALSPTQNAVPAVP